MSTLIEKVKGWLKKVVYWNFERRAKAEKSVITQNDLRSFQETHFYETDKELVFVPDNFSLVATESIPSWITDLSKSRTYKGSSFTVLKNAFIVGKHGTVIYEGKAVLDSALNSLGYLLDKNEKRLIRFQKYLPINSTYPMGISLANSLSNSYFHWVAETLPMLEALKIFEKQNEYSERVSVFITEHPPPYVYEYLALFNIAKERIVSLSSEKILVSKLIVPSTRFYALQNPHDYWSRHIYPKSAFDFLRNELLRKFNKVNTQQKKILLSREDAASRNVVNQKDLEELLKKHDYQCIVMSDLSVSEQIELFSSMTHLVTPHGAGMTNTIFSQQLQIIELYPITRAFYYNYHYYQVSNHFDHHHTMLLCDCDKKENMIVDLEKLTDILD